MHSVAERYWDLAKTPHHFFYSSEKTKLVKYINDNKQLKEFGDKLSDDKKKPIEDALEELKKAYETKEIEVIDPALEKINELWKSASEEMYKAQAESQQGAPNEADQNQNKDAGSDDVEDVDFEEVKED